MHWTFTNKLAWRLMPALTLLCCTTAYAEVRVPKLLSDHAVLQREAPIHIWGWADPGEAISISFHAQKLSAVADGLGKWSAYLAPEHAGGPYTLSVQGTNTVTLSDILVGDVWIASGQSNMEFPLNGFPGNAVMKNGPEEIAHANHPQMRLLHIKNNSSDYPLADQDATWAACTPETAATFSAVAYFFGREISEREHVPIGLIDSTWGGTPVSSWLSLDAIASDASLMPIFAARAQMAASHADEPLMIAKEKREDDAAKQAGQPLPKHGWHPNPVSWQPAGLYNAMIAPATGYSIKGALWYQGESDSAEMRAPLYEPAFTAMITDWRAKWGEGDFPFLFVQISSFTSTPSETWGIVREAQRRTLKLTHTGMAVTLDVGQADNVHPPDKQTVGARLALAARSIAYGESLEFSGPIFRQATLDGSQLRVWFTHGDELSARGGALAGFEVAGDDHHFKPAQARIDGDTVLVSSSAVKAPVYVRYGWANAPEATLYNKAGLPASTFTSEEKIPLPCHGACTE